jgi:hypothetical protein
MGMMPERETVEVPERMSYLFELYKEIRFSVTEDNKLLPRQELTFADLNEYKQAMQFDLSATECSVIMRADAVFNKSIQ